MALGHPLSCTKGKVDKGATFSSGEPRGLFGLASCLAARLVIAVNQTPVFHRLAVTSHRAIPSLVPF